ncbi:MAG: hypothetical protein PHV71_07410 [Eubacteriales bacterium]|nr:hypothetical protein [Eubacteriales bacterium]MDD3200129.1 hypothetical protein [Eubacteriales bacterium]MDD4630396.1 hypothetical protein [Eubacteriales bacterium]
MNPNMSSFYDTFRAGKTTSQGKINFVRVHPVNMEQNNSNSREGGVCLTAAIAYFIAGISTVALIALLFFNAYSVLSRDRKDIRKAEDNLRLIEDCFNGMRNTPDEISARRMLKTSTQIYIKIEKRYNEALQNPLHRLPGLLMGFRKMERIHSSSGEEVETLRLFSEQQKTDCQIDEL